MAISLLVEVADFYARSIVTGFKSRLYSRKDSNDFVLLRLTLLAATVHLSPPSA